MSDIPTIYCEHSQPVWEAAAAHNYPASLYRVGASRDDKPRDGETIVARVKVGRHSLPIPIFRREVTNNE